MITHSSHAAWLDSRNEDVVEPDLPIIDAHHHLWHGYGEPVPWQPDYWLEELAADVSTGHNIRGTVFVECGYHYHELGPAPLRPVGETEAIDQFADDFSSVTGSDARACAAIVGFADLSLGAEVDEVLEAHLEVNANRFRGIRQITPWHPSPEVRYPGFQMENGFMVSADFMEGFSRLSKYGLSFDAWLFHPQIPELATLARQCPDTTLIVDHFGGPLGVGPYKGRRAEVFEHWKKDIALLSQFPNVYMKLGGLGMEHAGYDWHERDLPPTSDELVNASRDFFLFAIDVFGPARCILESNFPVDKISYSYRTMWNAYKKMTREFSESERGDMFHDTASRVYRLDT